MSTIIVLFYLLFLLIVVLVIIIIVSKHNKNNTIEDMFYSSCKNGKTYYNLPISSTSPIVLYANESQCKDLCSYSPKCASYLVDKNNICYIYDYSSLDSPLLNTNYTCKYPALTSDTFNQRLDKDLWRWGEFKKDKVFNSTQLSPSTNDYWNMCNFKPSYWNIMPITSKGKEISSDQCSSECKHDSSCLGWQYVDGACYLYGEKDLDPNNKIKYTCDPHNMYGRLGNWKTKIKSDRIDLL